MKKIYLTLTTILVTSMMVIAQDVQTENHQVAFSVPATSILDIEGPNANNSIFFSPEAVTDAGVAFDFNLSNSTLWLNYTNVKATVGGTRRVTVGMTNELPTGMTLKVSAGLDSGNGQGEKGSPVATPVTLVNGSTFTLITGIGSAFTGDGVNSGHLLTYNLVFDDDEFQTLTADLNKSVTITYTIADE